MATKDWKKTQDDWSVIEYQHKKTKQRIVIFIIGLVPSKREYDVDIEYVGRKPGFKTKSQAVKFAKKYMRTH